MAERNNAIEAAVAKLIKARLFDEATWCAEKLPSRRRMKAFKAIVRAIG